MPALGFGYVFCEICNEEIKPFQLISGIPIKRNKKTGEITQLKGHYQCVKGELGAERVLKAFELGLLPNIPDSELEGGKLKKFVRGENLAAEARNKVYEFIGN